MAEQYPEHFVRRLEILWGDGFMSPGGAGEVHEALLGIGIRGKRILDFGCGIGGPSFVLAAGGAAEVIGIDVEPQLVARATVSAERLGLGNVSFQCVEPGPLGFADQSFDMVFSKEALLHIPDREAIFRDIARLLKTAGKGRPRAP